MGQSDPLHALKIASKSSKKTQKKKKKETKTKTKVGIMKIENKNFFFLKRHFFSQEKAPERAEEIESKGEDR